MADGSVYDDLFQLPFLNSGKENHNLWDKIDNIKLFKRIKGKSLQNRDERMANFEWETKGIRYRINVRDGDDGMFFELLPRVGKEEIFHISIHYIKKESREGKTKRRRERTFKGSQSHITVPLKGEFDLCFDVIIGDENGDGDIFKINLTNKETNKFVSKLYRDDRELIYAFILKVEQIINDKTQAETLSQIFRYKKTGRTKYYYKYLKYKSKYLKLKKEMKELLSTN